MRVIISVIMFILAIETSCDETSASIVEDGVNVLSNVVASQTEFHKKYGGIVPEIASRKHAEVISPVIKEAFEKAQKNYKDIDAVVVTFGPGLPGSLIVGLSAAKAISYSLKIPLIGVNHLEGHIYANFLSPSPSGRGVRGEGLERIIPNFPFVSLVVSGGHTQLVLVKDHCEFETLGRTRDDAAGEAFDKVARFLGLGYPGGPIIDELSKSGKSDAVDFKRPMSEENYKWDFSFSGIKTGVVYYVKKHPDYEKTITKADLAASFQKSVVDTLVQKTIGSAKENNIKTIVLAGGVCANSLLRSSIQKECENNGLQCFIPPISLCTDNAAMIGCAGYFRYKKGIASDLKLSIESTAKL